MPAAYTWRWREEKNATGNHRNHRGPPVCRTEGADLASRMKSLRFVILFAVALAHPSFASDESLANGVPGTYARSTSMFVETINLKRDRTFVFTHRFDVGSDTESGTWKVTEGVVLLDPTKRGQVIQHWPAKFLIVTANGDLALRALDDGSRSDDDEDPSRLFRPVRTSIDKPTAKTTRTGV